MATRKCVVGCNAGGPFFQIPDGKKPEGSERRKEWLRLLGVNEPYEEHQKTLHACHRHFSYKMRGYNRLHRNAVPDHNLNVNLKLPAVKLKLDPAVKANSLRLNVLPTLTSATIESESSAQNSSSNQHEPPLQQSLDSVNLELSTVKLKIDTGATTSSLRLNVLPTRTSTTIESGSPAQNSSSNQHKPLLEKSLDSVRFELPAVKLKLDPALKTNICRLNILPTHTSTTIESGSPAQNSSPKQHKPLLHQSLDTVNLKLPAVKLKIDPTVKTNSCPLNVLPTRTSQTIESGSPAENSSSSQHKHLLQQSVDSVNLELPAVQLKIDPEVNTNSCRLNVLHKDTSTTMESGSPAENSSSNQHKPIFQQSLDSVEPSPILDSQAIDRLYCKEQMPIEYNEKKLMAVVGRMVQTDASLSSMTPRKMKLFDDIRNLKQKLEFYVNELKLKEKELKLQEKELEIRESKLQLSYYENEIHKNSLKIKDEEIKIKNEEIRNREIEIKNLKMKKENLLIQKNCKKKKAAITNESDV